MVNEFIPKTKQETLELIDQHDVYIMSGGTDLMVQHKNWANLPALFNKDIVYVRNLEELNYVKKIDNALHIGATTSMCDILNHDLTPVALKEATSYVASPGIRNMATLAGNIGNASPAGDTLPVLYILDALIKLESVNGERIIPINEVITGVRRLSLHKNEMITEIIIPLKRRTKEVFKKVGGRKADAISKVSFAALINIENDLVTEFKVAYGAVGPTIKRDKTIEAKYLNIPFREFKNNIENILNDFQKIITPIDDQRSNKEYRNKVAINILNEFINGL